MEFNNNINDIDFDGARIISVEHSNSDLSIELQNCVLMKSHPAFSMSQDKIESLKLIFHAVSEEKSELFVGEGISEPNTNIPPINTIELFKEENDKYQFSGYVDNTPWAVWGFKASSYTIIW